MFLYCAESNSKVKENNKLNINKTELSSHSESQLKAQIESADDTNHKIFSFFFLVCLFLLSLSSLFGFLLFLLIVLICYSLDDKFFEKFKFIKWYLNFLLILFFVSFFFSVFSIIIQNKCNY